MLYKKTIFNYRRIIPFYTETTMIWQWSVVVLWCAWTSLPLSLTRSYLNRQGQVTCTAKFNSSEPINSRLLATKDYL